MTALYSELYRIGIGSRVRIGIEIFWMMNGGVREMMSSGGGSGSLLENQVNLFVLCLFQQGKGVLCSWERIK